MFYNIKKVWNKRCILKYIFHTIYFNFHYLPINQAIRLPIILYKPHFVSTKGKIKIISNKPLHTGMILLGVNNVHIYPDNGIIYENQGGTIIFKGSCIIGNNSAISIGKNGKVEFGDKFHASTTFKLISNYKINFSNCVRVGWDCIFLDNDFHKMTKINGGYTKGYGKISIGKNNWFGLRCIILKNTKTSDYCTISGGSILNKEYKVPPYTIIGNNNNITTLRSNVWRNIDDDLITYPYEI